MAIETNFSTEKVLFFNELLILLSINIISDTKRSTKSLLVLSVLIDYNFVLKAKVKEFVKNFKLIYRSFIFFT